MPAAGGAPGGAPGDVVRTVLGDVAAADLGVTLVHEHLHIDASHLVSRHGYVAGGEAGPFDPATAAECRWNPAAHPDNYRMTDAEAVREDLADYRSLGGRAIVDATPRDLGRSPRALRGLAEESGLHVVMGTGYYLEATHRAWLPAGDEEAATYAGIVAEHDAGTDGVRPGIIGEIGTSDPPTCSELAVLRGAARAAAATGLPLTVHLHPWGHNGPRVVEAVLDTGLAPGRVLLNHVSTAAGAAGYLRELLDAGVLLGFDLFGFDHSLLGLGRYPPGDDVVADAVVSLLSDGYLDQVLLSQDVGVRTRLRRYGGWGYGHLLRHVVPLLIARGLRDTDIIGLLTRNPGRYLTLEAG
jgi:phosphotriesterase-related protein